MFPMISIIVAIFDSPYFSEVISSVTKATSKYLLDDPTERTILVDELLLAAVKKVDNTIMGS